MKIDRGHLILGGLLAVIIAVLCIMSVYARSMHNNVEDLHAQAALDAMKFEELEQGLARSQSNEATQKELNDSLKSVFGDQLDTVLADIAELKAKPSTVHYVETTLPGETIYITDTDIPIEYKFRTRDGMSVAEYNYIDRQFRATTYDLSFNSSVVVSEDKYGNKVAHVQATAETSDPTDDGVYALDIDNSQLIFTQPKENTWFWWAPHVDAGVTAGYNFTEQKGSLYGSIGISPFAYGKTQSDNVLRVAKIRGSFSTGAIGIGIDPISVNIAKPLPLVDDIWLGIGPTFATDGNSLHATISSTF